MHNLRPWLCWLPAIAMMAILFAFSSQSYQEQSLVPDIEKNTSDQSISDWFGGIRFSYGGHEISVDSVGGASFIEFFIRKAAHFGSYALLAALLVYALSRNTWANGGRRYFYAILIAFLYACTDELHQSFTPGRTAMVQDVVLDTIGAACGASFTILLNRWRGAGKRRRA
ncbi:VanZ family protein [Paenibacillus sp. DXFW5]|uniref:VanZ family protein n=1 Tax=Paenibacillus rhizolycopersici TaxID=2780073 RepID=A0ABS2H735_9BACL|nr:VanZ family protein [Paenibacillus rhizolycopersici]MBM6997235.1 VanZ family protein [Paenibacillus rhizolycopersici]